MRCGDPADAARRSEDSAAGEDSRDVDETRRDETGGFTGDGVTKVSRVPHLHNIGDKVGGLMGGELGGSSSEWGRLVGSKIPERPTVGIFYARTRTVRQRFGDLWG